MTVSLWCHLPHYCIPWILYQVIVRAKDLINLGFNLGGQNTSQVVLWSSFCIMSWDIKCLNAPPIVMLKLISGCRYCRPDLSFIKFLTFELTALMVIDSCVLDPLVHSCSNSYFKLRQTYSITIADHWIYSQDSICVGFLKHWLKRDSIIYRDHTVGLRPRVYWRRSACVFCSFEVSSASRLEWKAQTFLITQGFIQLVSF